MTTYQLSAFDVLDDEMRNEISKEIRLIARNINLNLNLQYFVENFASKNSKKFLKSIKITHDNILCLHNSGIAQYIKFTSIVNPHENQLIRMH